MEIGTLGDLAKGYSLQTRNASLKKDIQGLTIELSSGQVADVRKAVTGKTAYVNDIARSLAKLDAYDLATTEVSQFASGVQAALDRINEVSVTFNTQLIAVGNTGYNAATSGLDEAARQTLQSVVGALNGNIAGRSLFAGTAVDTLPLVDSATLEDQLRTVVAGAGSVDDMIAAATTWFDDPAGFAATAYRGTDQSLAPVSLSDTEAVTVDLRADDPTFRATLRGLTLLALADDPALGLTDGQKSELFLKTTEPLLAATDDLTKLQSRVGFAEGNIETFRSRSGAERSALEMARNGILSADPFETATKLEQVQFQLQSLYAVTSRMSRLSLVNFL